MAGRRGNSPEKRSKNLWIKQAVAYAEAYASPSAHYKYASRSCRTWASLLWHTLESPNINLIGLCMRFHFSTRQRRVALQLILLIGTSQQAPPSSCD
ncbi:unnamed protein product [Sphenostylis stenocarpa]|uniref:Uncharacterized protein n=1 Tax=Sphenostylis stenocarpa TaxID=92480 RepID=A0AA86S621_9FABA|nr:unnamed protein product [Sphenostylis stenocarpa]